MNSGLNPANPILVAAFRTALVHQWAIVALIFALLLMAWGMTRTWVAGRGRASLSLAAPAIWHEPRARRLLRVGFGALWLFDGILQAQPQMAGGLPSQVIEPAASSSPAWVQHLVNAGGTIWSYHPVQTGVASVWIQAGIGMWLIFGVRGWSSRLAGLASAGWGLIVWAFGEAFGGIFAPGLTVLFGAPGAVLVYAVAGALITLPERVWTTARPGRLILGGMGVFFAGMAVLQAWPGRGFWQGTIGGRPGTLAGMVQSMAGTSQPHVLSALVSAFGNFTAAHGFAVNLFAVVVLTGMGAAFCAAAVRADAQLARIGVAAGAVFCLADWVLVEDLGFLGGLGTDPNSMIPLILLFTVGYLALTPAPRDSTATVTAPVESEAPGAVAAFEAAVTSVTVADHMARPAAVAAVKAGMVGTVSMAGADRGLGPVELSGSGAGTESVTRAGAGLAAGAGAGPGAGLAAGAGDTPGTEAVSGAGAGPTAGTATGAGAGPTAGPAGETDIAPGPETAAEQGIAPEAAGPQLPSGTLSSGMPSSGMPARLASLRRAVAAASGRSVAAFGAVGVILVGAAPMAFASADHNADPIIAQALAGSSGSFDTPASNFTLTSQDGRQVSLASLRGKVVLLTFLDPVCTTDCPIIAQEMRAADTILGARAKDTELVAVAANPTYFATAFTRAFTRQEGLDQVPNWLYLTGSLPQLQAVWRHYGILVENVPAGAMSAHNDLAFVIDASGNIRQEFSDDPGPGTAASKSSFAGLLASSVLSIIGQGQ
jgi:cytochrome oxidase Cu insertion factor (SCO1/SenC/PrrC family)